MKSANGEKWKENGLENVKEKHDVNPTAAEYFCKVQVTKQREHTGSFCIYMYTNKTCII